MKKVILFAVVAVAMLGAAALQPANAACSSPRLFTSIENAGAGLYSYVYTPGFPFPNGGLSDNMEAVFWSFSGGNPASGLGNDNGSWSALGGTAPWFYQGYNVGTLFYPGSIYNVAGTNTWANGSVDGCIDNDGSVGPPDPPPHFDLDQCMVVLVTDQVGGVGYFALVAQSPTPAGAYFLNQAAGNGAITLAPIPKPQITGSTAVGNNVQLNMSVAAPAGPDGLYLNCSPAQNAALLQSFSLLVETTARNVAPTGTALPIAGGDGVLGGGATIDVTCSDTQDTDVYVCATLGFDSNYSTSVCSENATTVQCGPTLGDPLEIRPQPREFGHRPARSRPAADRGTRGR